MNGDSQTQPLPGGLSPDSIDVPSELATILSRISYTAQPPPPPPASPHSKEPPPERLLPKELPTATDPVKHKLQSARAAVRTLPDIQRTIPEQEAEIAELRALIERQRAALSKLKEFGLQFAAEGTNNEGGDVDMGGMEARDAEGSSG